MIELIDSLGSDLAVANAARASFDKQKDVFDSSDEKLLAYLAREKHETPFGHVQITMRATAPIFIARQWFKSKVGSVENEVSRRYVSSQPEFWFPTSWRSRPDGSIKQGSGEDLPDDTQDDCDEIYIHALDTCQIAYDALLKQGVAPEQARGILPQSMLTTFVITGSLLYWARVYRLRKDSHAQAEWKEFTTGIDNIIKEIVPISWKELTK